MIPNQIRLPEIHFMKQRINDMTTCEKEHFKEISHRMTFELAELRKENKTLQAERDLWKKRALALAAAVELLEAEMALK